MPWWLHGRLVFLKISVGNFLGITDQIPFLLSSQRRHIITAKVSWGGYGIGSVCVLSCRQDYCRSNWPILLKLGVMYRLTFAGDLVADTDFGSLFHFPTIAEFGILGDVLVQSLATFHESQRNDCCPQGNECIAFWEQCNGLLVLDQSRFESRMTSGWSLSAVLFSC